MQKPIIGAHVSAAGGLYKAFQNAKNIGAEAIQIFGVSPRQWIGKLPDTGIVDKFKEEHTKSGVGEVYLHAAYLVNLASPNKFIVEKSIQSLAQHLQIAEMIGAVGLVFHVGSSKGVEDRNKAIMQQVEGMKEILKRVPGKAKLIMENSAGGGQKIGSAEDIGVMLSRAKSERVKVCFDTAHAFEAGVVTDYTKTSVKKLFDEWDEKVGLKNVIVIHANDSKTTCGSHHDRHENIGKGFIGMKGFEALAEEKRLWDKPWILEVPGEGNGPDKKNVEVLKKYFK